MITLNESTGISIFTWFLVRVNIDNFSEATRCIKHKRKILDRFLTVVTRLIVIDIAPLTALFCNCPFSDLQLPAVKRLVSIPSVCWFSVINQWLNVWFVRLLCKSPSWFLKSLKLFSFYLGNFKILKNALGQFIPNHPPKHVITSTNVQLKSPSQACDY